MRSGIAQGNTHRKLDVGEFRGFAISNVLTPVVFINSADADTARLFILDRLVHNAYRINLKGESMRKSAKKLTTSGTSD